MNTETTLPAPSNPGSQLPVAPDQFKQMLEETGVSATDLVIPKLLLMQNTSEYVGNDTAKMGDIVNSQTLEVIGSVGKPVEVIPLKLYKTWRTYSLASGQPKFLREEPVTAQNASAPWEDKEPAQDGKGTIPIRRDMNFNFFVLLKSELEAGEGFPVVVSFKRTSMNAGKQLATQLFKMLALGRAPYSSTMKLGVKKEKKDTNTYALFECAKGEPCSEQHKAEAKLWLERLQVITFRVAEDKEHDAGEPVAEAPRTSSTPPDTF